MRFITITIFTVTLVALTTANPVPNRMAGGGMAIQLVRHESPNKTIDLDTITSHGISVREKILSGMDNYKRNTGRMHPLAMQRSEPDLGTRDTVVPLTPFGYSFWSVEISIGTPPQTLKMFLDTGSSDMWVAGVGCSGVSRDRNFWNPKASNSAKKCGKWCWNSIFRFKYADGSMAKGTLFTDNVTIGGLTANPQTFGSATSYTPGEVSNSMFPTIDGILGFAHPSHSRISASPLFASLVAQGRLINPIFSLKLSPSGGEMYLGGANSMLYNGDITYTRVTVQGHWQVSMDDFRVNGDKFFENQPAVIDTGANYIYGDWDQVSELYRHLGGTLLVLGGFGFYHLPCDSFPTLGLTFGARTFEIPPEVFRRNPISEGSPYCFGAILAMSQTRSLPFWVIGMPFLQGVYSVFDYSTFQVGFADLA